MYFNGFTLLCCIIVVGSLSWAIWQTLRNRDLAAQIEDLEFNYDTAIDVGADLLSATSETCCNCGDDDGPYPVCLDCLMQITGVAPSEMSLHEIIDDLGRTVARMPQARSDEWDRLMRGVNGG